MGIDDPKLYEDSSRSPNDIVSEKPTSQKLTFHYTTIVPIFISLHLHKGKMEIQEKFLKEFKTSP